MRGPLLFSLLLVLPFVPSASADPPSAPTNLVAVVSADSSSVALNWTAPDSGNYTYSVFRGAVHVADVTGLTYRDSQPDLLSVYSVVAVNGGAKGPAAVLVVNTVGFCGAIPTVAINAPYIVMSGNLCQPTNTSCD